MPGGPTKANIPMHHVEVLQKVKSTTEKPTDVDFKELRTLGYLEGNELGVRLSPLGVKIMNE